MNYPVRVTYATNADTEVLALRVAWEDLPGDIELSVVGLGELGGLEGARAGDIVVVRALGGIAAVPGGDSLAARARALGAHLLVLPGEAVFDEPTARASTVPLELVRRAFAYAREGGAANLGSLLRLLAAELAGVRVTVPEPSPVALVGRYGETAAWREGGTSRIAVVFYRAHLIAGNTAFVDELLAVAEAEGLAVRAWWAYSARGEPGVALARDLAEAGTDVVIVTVLAGGEAVGLGWEPGPLGALGIPVVQAPISTVARSAWEASDAGLVPLDVAMSVAIPEYDGRIIAVPIAFKELVDADETFGAPVHAYRTDPERARRTLRLAARLGALRRTPNGAKRIAVVLSAYPTKRSRLGNAVGLDTPQSLVGLARRMGERGFAVGELPEPNALMSQLAALLDPETPTRRARGGVSMAVDDYLAWYATLPEELRAEVEAAWGPPPGERYVEGNRLWFPALRFGNLLVAIQPPRGYGADEIAIYHSPDLAPSHHYLAFYRYLAAEAGVGAVVHLGKHGTLEWLPGKGVGLSARCWPDVALGELPLVYPFVVNDPGEGIQAKRRSHAVIVDHLVPPLTRADGYGAITELETLLDEHQRIAALDPDKLPEIRAAIWEVLASARIHEDLGVDAPPSTHDDAFDELLLAVDGYLCELKDAIIRGGLHVLGEPPGPGALVDLVAQIVRVPQLEVPSLAEELDRHDGRAGNPSRSARDEASGRLDEVLWALAEAGWDPGAAADERWLASVGLAGASAELRRSLAWVAGSLVPRIQATREELDRVVDALEGRAIPPGPAGAPSRGMAHVLPTGRNFYGLDPRAVPSRLSWRTGQRAAEALRARFRRDEGRELRHASVVLWGTAALRTGGDDVALILALLGVEPRWDEISGRVAGLELVPLARLGRPRVDVTVRVSGLFRDAFPQAVALIDEALELAAKATDEGDANPVARAGTGPRIFGPPPRAYGSGVLDAIERGAWSTAEDLGRTWMRHSAYAYGRALAGEPADEALAHRLGDVEAILKAQDNREHDILDSDDYLQDHGGMVAAARAVGNDRARGYLADTSRPQDPAVRSIEEEAARVVRTRAVNPKWLSAMRRHGYKGAFEMAATVDYLFGYDAAASVGRDWMYDAVTDAYVADSTNREFLLAANPAALAAICDRLLEADRRGMWAASPERRRVLAEARLLAEGAEE